MARQATEQTQSTRKGPGRPPKDESRSAEEIAVSNLQNRLDALTSDIADHPNVSLVARAGRCARAGVPRSTVNKAIAAVKGALADAEVAIERAYSAPPETKTVVGSRVTL